MIEVAHLYKNFNDQPVLEDINLTVKEGEILVILGQSGAGKSVLLQHLIGLLKPDRGCVKIDTTDITRLKEDDLLKVRQKIGYLFQQGALYDFLNVYENVAFPLHEHTRLSEKEISTRVHAVLELVGLKGAEEKMPSELSGGMIKRASLARSIVLDSKILFCDEPTSGLDPMRSRQITDLIHDISRKLKCTTVVTSHDMHNSFRMADRLVIIQDGRIMAMGTPDELKSSQDRFVQDFIQSG